MPWVLLQQATVLKGGSFVFSTPVQPDKAYLMERRFASGLPSTLWASWRKGSLVNPTNAVAPLFFAEREFQFCYVNLAVWRSPATNSPQAMQIYLPFESRLAEVSFALYRFD